MCMNFSELYLGFRPVVECCLSQLFQEGSSDKSVVVCLLKVGSCCSCSDYADACNPVEPCIIGILEIQGKIASALCLKYR